MSARRLSEAELADARRTGATALTVVGTGRLLLKLSAPRFRATPPRKNPETRARCEQVLAEWDGVA